MLRKFLLWLAAIVAVLVALLLIAGGAGGWLLVMLGIWAAMFAVAWLISRWTGGRPHYLETWPFADGETTIWRDDRADTCILAAMTRAAITRPLRLHRARVIVTTQRILVATSELFTRRQRIIYVLYVGSAPNTEDTGTFGGEFKTGYQTLVLQPDVMDIRIGERMQPSPYIALKPDPAVPSSFNCTEFRIYTDLYDSFRLPGSDASTK